MPCSLVMRAASSSAWASSNALNLNITLARRAAGVAAQAGKAAVAAATAASISARPARATCLVTFPVAGS